MSDTKATTSILGLGLLLLVISCIATYASALVAHSFGLCVLTISVGLVSIVLIKQAFIKPQGSDRSTN